MNTKEIATSFLTLASAGNVAEAFAAYVHPRFRHHNVYFKGDRDALEKAMAENAREFPEKRYETMHALADGDLVAVHGKVTLGPKTYGVIHIFRFADGQIIESWEASQEAVADSPNEHGLF
jgi:predicted SnoaL-like aldol condensation-catalyzing enzyme